MKKRNVRIEQLSIDIVVPDNLTQKDVIDKITEQFLKIGVEVIGFMPTDTSWTWNEYFNLE